MAIIEPVFVVCGIISNVEGEILMARRKLGKHLAGYWEFPGGKVENESEEVALKRELWEELGMTVSGLHFFSEHRHQYDRIQIVLRAYSCRCDLPPTRSTDHDKLAWTKTKDLMDLRLSPADIPIAARWLEQQLDI